MENSNLIELKKRSIKSVFALTGRTIFLQLINLLGYFFITVFLEKAEFGLFILVSAIIDILGYFSDIGLAAALIQKREEPTIKEIRSTFTIQQLIVSTIIIILLLTSPIISKIYGFNRQGILLLYSFAFAFFLSSLKTIPSVLLERKLEFSKIVIPQFIETIAFNLIVVILAWKGFGLTSFTVAVLVRGILGTLTLYLIAPWQVGLNFSFSALKKLLHFGVPYQLNSLLAVVKDKIMILFLGVLIGKEGIALVGWAEKWATMPLRYLLDNTIKVAFPTFARLEHDKEKLKIAVEKTLYFLVIGLLPSLAGIVLLAKPVILLIPRLAKWEPALIPLYFYCFASIWGSLAVLLTTVFNSIGKIKVTFKLMIFWTFLSWIAIPLLASKFNVIGVAAAITLVNLTSIIGIFILKRIININYFSQIIGPVMATFIMLISTHLLQPYFPHNLWGIISTVIIGILSYSISLLIFDNKKFFSEMLYLKKELYPSAFKMQGMSDVPRG